MQSLNDLSIDDSFRKRLIKYQFIKKPKITDIRGNLIVKENVSVWHLIIEHAIFKADPATKSISNNCIAMMITFENFLFPGRYVDKHNF